jgi:oligopeptide/dipeptide ABC transporter ATP-binding protein
MSPAVLELRDVAVEYGRRTRRVRVVDGVDLSIEPGEIVGLVGESGCGKSSLGRAAVGLEPLAAGSAEFLGRPVRLIGRRKRAEELRRLQMVFQDPYDSLNPRRKIGELIGDGVVLGGGRRAAGDRRAATLLERVGLPADAVKNYAHEFSGGQRQRIAIARALAADPACIVADEPISSLDASAQAQVVNLLIGLTRDMGMGLLFISHDLSVVRQVADRIAVMYLGRIVETGDTGAVGNSPQHPYTAALLAAIPRADGSGRLPVDLPGDVPDPANPPAGCRFHPRCPIAEDRCRTIDPRLAPLEGREVACTVRVDAGRDSDGDQGIAEDLTRVHHRHMDPSDTGATDPTPTAVVPGQAEGSD